MATHGRDAKLYIAKTGGATAAPTLEADWVEIELATDATFNAQKASVETTNRGSGGDDEFLPGHRNSTYDFTAIYDPANAGIKAAVDNFFADGQMTWFRDRPVGAGTGKPETVFKGFVTNKPVAMPGKDKVTIQFTIQVSGKPTSADQAGA